MSAPTENAQTREVGPEYEREFEATLRKAVEIVEEEGVPYVLAGSLASNTWGRPSAIGDVDIVVDPTDAKRLLKVFERAGFDTEEAEPQWLYKASQGNVTVDLIFQMEGDLYMNDRMVEKASVQDVSGTRARVMAPEDYVISQALSAKEDTPDFWYNALGVLARSEVEWDYLIERASRGPRRVLSLLLYAQSNDLAVPDSSIRRLIDSLYPTA